MIDSFWPFISSFVSVNFYSFIYQYWCLLLIFVHLFIISDIHSNYFCSLIFYDSIFVLIIFVHSFKNLKM